MNERSRVCVEHLCDRLKDHFPDAEFSLILETRSERRSDIELLLQTDAGQREIAAEIQLAIAAIGLPDLNHDNPVWRSCEARMSGGMCFANNSEESVLPEHPVIVTVTAGKTEHGRNRSAISVVDYSTSNP